VTEAGPVPSRLAGVRFGRIARHGDERGSFRELWRAEAFAEMPRSAGALDAGSDAAGPAGSGPLAFVQANVSTSAAGVLRGLHLHRRQLDHWVVARGRAFVALVDVRPRLDGSSPRPVVETRVLVADETVTIPAGVAHGFLALEPLELVYFVTNSYDGSDELGFAWDDPAVAVPWPTVEGTPRGRPITSERDAANPSLAELVARLQS
jgi:dTDP-4-dehydrorhamnose 3,5-epimerase